jgi:hypothetical protein
MKMNKIIDRIYQIFGIILFLSFFLTIITGIFLIRLNLDGHSFNVPAFFVSLLFISLFVVFTLKPSWKTNSATVSGWKKYLLAILILFMAVTTSYFGIYLPLHSKLLVEITSQFLSKSEPFEIKAESNKKYYLELDTAYTLKGTTIEINVNNESWSDEFTFVVGKEERRRKNKKISSGTTIVDLPFNFPVTGTYNLFIKVEGDTSPIKNIRLFENFRL